MHLAPYSVVKVGDKWAVHVCGARVMCFDRRAIAIRAAVRARELLDVFETGRIDADGSPSASRPAASASR